MKEQNEVYLTLQDLNISIETWFELNQEYAIPLYIHIKDINEYDEKVSNYKIDILNKSYRINKLDSPFKNEILQYNIKKTMDYYLKFIDERKLFNGKSFSETLDFPIYDLFDEGEFRNFVNEINHYIHKVKFMFLVEAKLLLEYDRKFPKHYTPKENDTPEDVKENTCYPIGMTMIQGEIEYPSNILFEENINKPVSQHSFREVQLKAMYIHMKNKIEGFLNSYQAWKMEKDRPKSK